VPMRRSRPTSPPPLQLGRTAGLAWARYVPHGAPRGALLVIHGADSTKESHAGFARRAQAAGWCTLCYDARGHGQSEGAMDGRLLDDVAAMAGELPADVPLALRGTSLGGYTAIVAADAVGADAVVAICAAPVDALVSALRAGRFAFALDRPALLAFLSEHDDLHEVSSYAGALLLMHAEGDETVPYQHSVALDAAAVQAQPRQLHLVEGGDHRSIQHDPAQQALALAWLEDVVRRP
jgi:uncharacterized protein